MNKAALIRIQAESFDPASEIDAFRAASGDIGALAAFTGYVRGERGQVDALELEHYPGFTEMRIEEIVNQAVQRFDLAATMVVHRYGRMAPGEAIVMVAASSSHRKDAFEAVDFLMDFLKTDAPFWKKQSGPEGDAWIEPRAEDRQARRSWEDQNI